LNALRHNEAFAAEDHHVSRVHVLAPFATPACAPVAGRSGY
jgi:hypothetical protein